MTSRRADALAVLLLAAAAAAVLAKLGRLPALTSDEAWVGLYALRVRPPWPSTPHEMNTYTGPLFGLLVSLVLSARGMSVAALRTFGACANAAAFLLLVATLRRRAGSAAAAWGAALLAGSAYLLLKSRLAWECYALQPLLLAVTLALLDEPTTAWRALLFCAVALIGVQNHFIYLSVLASLCVLYGARAAWLGEEGARPWLRLSLSALAMGAVVFLVKPRLTTAAWPVERAWAVPAFLALAPLAAAAAVLGGEWESPLVSGLSRPAARLWCLRGLGAGVAAFVIWHAAPLWQALAGPVVWRRVLSWDAPWWLALPLDLWAALLLGLLAWRAARAWHGREPMSTFERTLALWPAAYAAIFILFRNTSSLRYYSPVQFLCLASLAAALPRLARPDRKAAAALAAFAVLAAQGVFWRELASPGDRRPLTFKIGWHSENSRDFSRKEGLFAAFDASGACAAAHQERSFVAIPLDFHRLATGPLPCDPAKAFDADQCPGCAAPPFYRWSIVSARP
ncbi:MAG TPA: hypothetical protein VH309_11455 [Elusimicrobiota bacterium]|jgi:hypothetical protein|nr:hypothetical protein [Elusimicrobiota bacterium]